MSTAQPSATSTDVELIDGRTRARALMGSAIGSAVEWYDYFPAGNRLATEQRANFGKSQRII